MPFNADIPKRSMQLTKFGGLYTEADHRDIPEGASPLNYDVDFKIAGIDIRPGTSLAVEIFSQPAPQLFQWISSSILPNGLNHTIAQDSSGSLWAENIQGLSIMTRIYQGILNSARATSETINNREFICLSDFTAGSDQPRQWDGQHLDRISQVGPGAGPSVPAISIPIYTISSITEIYPAHSIDTVIWGALLNDVNAPPPSTDLYFMGVAGDGNFTLGLEIGDYVYVSNVPNMEGQNPNGTYQVVSIGYFSDQNGVHQYFGVTSSAPVGDFIRGSSGGTYQKTPALVQLSNPIPQQSAVVGLNIVISGSSVQGWNSTWPIADTPTEGQLSISSTSLTSNVASYEYTVTSGEAPGWQPVHNYPAAAQIVSPAGDTWQITTPGTSGGTIPAFSGSTQTDGTAVWTKMPGVTVPVTVFNTSNGNGIFNVQNARITSASSNSFTVAITSSNIVSAGEEGLAVSGTGKSLIIDPGATTLSSGSPGVSPIFGNATGGNVIPSSTQVAPGQRYCVCMFLTRNGYITPASPPVSFYTLAESATATFNDLPVGPPNVIARIVAITAANSGVGGPYFWIPEDVVLTASVGSLGATQTVNKTVVYDNTSTTLGPITLSDTVLLQSENISQVGNNLQQQRELGECVKVVQYAGRAFYIGERVKNDQFVNLTFDGGSVNGLPAGWTVQPGVSPYVHLVESPVFGQSLEISNTSGGVLNPSAALSSISALYQGAFETAIQTPIIQPNTAYSARITAECPSGAAGGALVVELYSPSLGKNWAFSLPLDTLPKTLQEFIGPFQNPFWQPVPSDLILRIYPLGMPNGASMLVDRIEVFPTLQPVYSTQVSVSYAENSEAIDAITGAIDTSEYTSEVETNHFRFLDSYYITTNTKHFSPAQTDKEPSEWELKEISNEVGCLGPLASDAGEEYILVADRNGVYIFDGGSHVKISQEIQSLWNLLYGPSMKSVWIRNDIKKQRILVGVPMPTPNEWLPKAPVNRTPQSPNVILMCSYLTLPNGRAIAEAMPVHVSMFTGSLLWRDTARKWTIWQIPAAIGAGIQRFNGDVETWLGQHGTISLLDEDVDTDNGSAIPETYATYGFDDDRNDQQFQLGAVRKKYPFCTAIIEGKGKFVLTAMAETINTPYPATLPAFKLYDPALNDQNFPLNVSGNRMFLQFSVDGTPGSRFSLSRVVTTAIPHPRIGVSGR